MLVPNEQQDWLQEVIAKITDKMDWVSEKSKHKIPYTTINGTHDDKRKIIRLERMQTASIGGRAASGAAKVSTWTRRSSC